MLAHEESTLLLAIIYDSQGNTSKAQSLVDSLIRTNGRDQRSPQLIRTMNGAINSGLMAPYQIPEAGIPVIIFDYCSRKERKCIANCGSEALEVLQIYKKYGSLPSTCFE
ncbi:MAG: hypothetical protein ACNI27_15165 [Desulfovibrio sp.]